MLRAEKIHWTNSCGEWDEHEHALHHQHRQNSFSCLTERQTLRGSEGPNPAELIGNRDARMLNSEPGSVMNSGDERLQLCGYFTAHPEPSCGWGVCVGAVAQCASPCWCTSCAAHHHCRATVPPIGCLAATLQSVHVRACGLLHSTTQWQTLHHATDYNFILVQYGCQCSLYDKR